jgi:hypothetical protein
MPEIARTIRRMYTSAKYGVQMAISSYNAENFVAEIDFEWESQAARMARYWHNRRYADNTIYATVNRYADTFKFKEKLYKHIRGLYNPINRLINLETAKVIGGTINYETFDSGAIQITGADEKLLEAIRTIYQWSNMDLIKTPYVRNGAIMGDSVLKVVDDLDRQKVRIEVLDPRKVTDVLFDSIGNIKFIEICYEKQDPLTAEWYEYKERIDKDSFSTYRNGESFDYLDMSSAGQWQWQNPYGFVPVRWVKHQDTGLDFGQTSWHNVRHKIDMVNDALSLLLNNVRMQVDTKFASFGADAPRNASGTPTTMSVTTERQDQAAFLGFPKDARLEPIVFPVAVTSALELAAVQIREIEADLPQLALQTMRGEVGNVSGVTIENLYNDSADAIADTQANYGFGLRSATQMAISMAAYRGYEGFQGYNLNSYENGALDFVIQPKSLFSDKLNLEKKIDLTMRAADSSAASLVLPLMDYSEEQIQELENTKAEESAAAIRGMFEGTFGNADKQQQEREKRLADENPVQDKAKAEEYA